MVPQFPNFSNLTLAHQKDLIKITSKYSPYSDFNFVSLHSYNVENNAQICQLHKNLVIKYSDYLTGQQFLTFIGHLNPNQTIEKLLKYAAFTKIDPKLKLVPEDSLQQFQPSPKIQISEDVDSFDYILDISKLITLQGNKLQSKRRLANKFLGLYQNNLKLKILDLSKPETKKEILEVFYKWEKSQQRSRNDTRIELKAINNLLDSAHLLPLICLGIFIDNKMVAFSIDEITHQHYLMIHFEKADVQYDGIFEYMKQQTAIHAQKLGCKFINYEQDLGIPGLRQAKLAYRPVSFLKKYTISIYQPSDL